MVQASVLQRTTVEFQVCGLPQSTAATFTPNGAVSAQGKAPPPEGIVTSQLAISVPHGTPPSTYELHISAFYKSSSGAPESYPAGGSVITPSSLVLTVDAAGNASLSVPPYPGVAGTTNCSPLDPSFVPAPTATPGPSDISVSAAISNQFPPVNQPVSVTGTLLVKGVPQYGALMTAKWYLPFSILTCTSVTDVNGRASCGFVNSGALPNYPVQVQLSFVVNGITYYAYTLYYM
jgi:hypothetical protein